jgi:hypothetical protein
MEYSVYIVFFVMLYPGRMIQHIYHAWCQRFINAESPKGKYILQHCIGLNIPEPLGLLLAGESVEELEKIIARPI